MPSFAVCLLFYFYIINFHPDPGSIDKIKTSDIVLKQCRMFFIPSGRVLVQLT